MLSGWELVLGLASACFIGWYARGVVDTWRAMARKARKVRVVEPQPFDLKDCVERVQRQSAGRCRCGHTPLQNGEPVVLPDHERLIGYVRHSKTRCEAVTG